MRRQARGSGLPPCGCACCRRALFAAFAMAPVPSSAIRLYWTFIRASSKLQQMRDRVRIVGKKRQFFLPRAK